MEDTKSKANPAKSPSNDDDRMAKARKSREIRTAMVAKLSAADKFLLKNVANARKACELLEQRIIQQQTITSEAVQAASVLAGQVAVLAGA